MNSYANAFTGVAFHCYAGSVSNQDLFHNAYPSKVSIRLFSVLRITDSFITVVEGYILYRMLWDYWI